MSVMMAHAMGGSRLQSCGAAISQTRKISSATGSPAEASQGICRLLGAPRRRRGSAAMPRLGLLLAALTPIRAWWERHAQDSSVLTLSVPAGDSFVRATQKLAEDCDLQESEAAIVDAFRGRYRFTLGDSDVAPYRMDLLVTSEHCHRRTSP